MIPLLPASDNEDDDTLQNLLAGICRHRRPQYSNNACLLDLWILLAVQLAMLPYLELLELIEITWNVILLFSWTHCGTDVGLFCAYNAAAECVNVALSHLKQLILSTDSEQVKVTINQLCDLLSPAPGVFSSTCSNYSVNTLWRFGLGGSALVSINEVTVCWARLVLWWVTGPKLNFWCRQSISVYNQPPRSTQPGHPSMGRYNEYQPTKGRWCFVAGE